MNVHLANSSKQLQGGGWSWIDNFRKGYDCVTGYESADVYLIPSPTMVQREEVLQAKKDGKKIVLRLDNVVRNSRNRNTGMSRMYDFAQIADLIVYQSQWAKNLLMPFLGKDGVVILNGTDLEVFNDYGRVTNKVYGYSRFSRDETKNFEVARFMYSAIQYADPEAELYVVGQYSQELIEGKFDFYMDEKYRYLGVLDKHKMASVYKDITYMIIPYYNDACSQTLIESLVSGCKLVPNTYLETGGSPEIIEMYNKIGARYFSLERMVNQYIEALGTL